ncbi:cyclic GMP-AMP synthase-like receptor 1 isoform 1-T3 [Cochliomyia hominivorax]
MSDIFNKHLLTIHQDISIKDEDRRPFTEMFNVTRDWLIREMRKADPVFDEMFKGTTLFGSYPNRVRIIKPSEFDVFILLDLPFDFKVKPHPDRPGFVSIQSNEWKSSKYKKIYRFLFFQYQLKGLNRNKLQRWIGNLIETVIFKSYKPMDYTIKYTRCAVAQNIYVIENRNPHKKISIDFVPAIMMPSEYMTPFINRKSCFKSEYFKSFVAIPKRLNDCGPKFSRRLTFQLVNPVAECDIIWDKQNLKIVYRLLKSLRNQYELKRLKSYFLTDLFLWEIKKRPNKFWQKPISDILFKMLEELRNYFRRGELPYYWVNGFNLLDILKDKEIDEYTETLELAFENLWRIGWNKNLKYSTVAEHFETRD